jgi:hypothetical protein
VVSLVIESALLQRRGVHEPISLRVAGGLSLHQGNGRELLPLLAHLFADQPPPDLASATVEFLLDGAAYQWRADFALGTSELANRTTGQLYSGPQQISAHLGRLLPEDPRVRAACFLTPEPEVPNADGCRMPSNPPASDRLAAELAEYETRLRTAGQAFHTATALYSDLFPLLEALEDAGEKLHLRLRQLERHREAEATLAEYRRLEAQLQAQVEAGRRARQLEKQVTQLGEEEKDHPPIPATAIESAAAAEAEVETARQGYIDAERMKKEAQVAAERIRPTRLWLSGLMGLPIMFAAVYLSHLTPYSHYLWGGGALLSLALPLAALQTAKRKSRRRIVVQCGQKTAQKRQELELCELGYMQVLRPYGARNLDHLKQKDAEQKEWQAAFEALRAELAEVRKQSGTDDSLTLHSAAESTQLAQLQEQCRAQAPYRLQDADRAAVEQMVHDLEAEARYQKEAAAELQKQCESLSAGWSSTAELTEQVSQLRRRLAEWQRWEKAFRRIREVIDRLPDIPDLAAQGPVTAAASYLQRITAGRWTKLHFDPIDAEFKIFDREAGLWIRADRENPAVNSTVDLAYRLSLIESHADAAQLPLWLEEPFAELPETMATATAGILAEAAGSRQVVLICRQKPQVQWPEGAILQS